jgi:hypothetical protein
MDPLMTWMMPAGAPPALAAAIVVTLALTALGLFVARQRRPR